MASVKTPNGESIDFDLSLDGLGNHRIELATDEGIIYLDIECGMQPPKPLYQDAQWLWSEYIDNDRTMAEIARQFGVTPMTINQWLKNHMIPTRPRGRRKAIPNT